MSEDFDIPDAPPVPPEERRTLGLPLLSIVNVLLALYLLFNSIAPIVWGQLIVTFENRAEDYGNFDRLPDREKSRQDQKAKSAANEELEVYQKFRMVHLVVAISSLLVAVVLARGSYIAMFYDQLSILPTSGMLVLAAVMLSVNFALGWGGMLSIIGILVAAVEAVLLFLPPVQRYLESLPPEEE